MRTTPSLSALNAFASVMRHGSVTEAARQLNITQPALSRLVARCERDLGVALFRRERKRLIPTELAENFLIEVERFLATHAELSGTALGLGDGLRSTLRIAAAPRLAYGLVGQTIRAMTDAGARSRFSVDSRERAEIERWVVSSRYDIGLASLPITYEGVRVTPFAEVPAAVLMRKDDPLADRAQVDIRDIAERRIIVTAPGSLMRERTISAFAEAGRSLNPSIEVGTSPLAAHYVSQGLGLFVVDLFSAVDLDKTLKVVPLRAGFSQRVGFLLPKGREASPLVADFMAAARQIAQAAGARLL